MWSRNFPSSNQQYSGTRLQHSVVSISKESSNPSTANRSLCHLCSRYVSVLYSFYHPNLSKTHDGTPQNVATLKRSTKLYMAILVYLHIGHHHNHQWLYSPSGPWPPLVRFHNQFLRHAIGLLGRVISPSQGLYLHRTTQHRKTKDKLKCQFLIILIRPPEPSGSEAGGSRVRNRGREILVTKHLTHAV
jgi:hypothetical protein